MTPWILGVDPGVISGWALLDPAGKPIAWGQTGKPGSRGTGEDVYDVLQKCGPLCHEWPPTLAIEGQFVPFDGGKGQGHRSQAVATLKTARHAGIWIGVCQRYGLPVFEHKGEPAVEANVWRSAVWGGRWSTAQAKAHAVKMALHAWGIRILKTHHHTAEAMWIATYALGEIRAQQQQQQLGV